MGAASRGRCARWVLAQPGKRCEGRHVAAWMLGPEGLPILRAELACRRASCRHEAALELAARGEERDAGAVAAVLGHPRAGREDDGPDEPVADIMLVGLALARAGDRPGPRAVALAAARAVCARAAADPGDGKVALDCLGGAMGGEIVPVALALLRRHASGTAARTLVARAPHLATPKAAMAATGGVEGPLATPGAVAAALRRAWSLAPGGSTGGDG